MRPSWDKYFFDMARLVATRSTCDRRHVGAVIVTTDRHVIATGYNGSPSRMPHCDDVGHELEDDSGNGRCIRTTHAEVNAIAQAAKHGQQTLGAILFCTCLPCLECSKLIISSGIFAVNFSEEASDLRGLRLMGKAGLLVHSEAQLQRKERNA